MSDESYHIDGYKMEKVIEIIHDERGSNIDAAMIRDEVLGDMNFSASAHQDWLDDSDARTIAEWVMNLYEVKPHE